MSDTSTRIALRLDEQDARKLDGLREAMTLARGDGLPTSVSDAVRHLIRQTNEIKGVPERSSAGRPSST